MKIAVAAFLVLASMASQAFAGSIILSCATDGQTLDVWNNEDTQRSWTVLLGGDSTTFSFIDKDKTTFDYFFRDEKERTLRIHVNLTRDLEWVSWRGNTYSCPDGDGLIDIAQLDILFN